MPVSTVSFTRTQGVWAGVGLLRPQVVPSSSLSSIPSNYLLADSNPGLDLDWQALITSQGKLLYTINTLNTERRAPGIPETADDFTITLMND